MMAKLTKPDLRDSPHEVAVDLIDSARAQLAVFDTPIFTWTGLLEDPVGAGRAVQDAVTLLERAAALLVE